MTISPTDGHLDIGGTFNYRDIGGLRTMHGTTIRPGVLLRSAQLSRLDESGHAKLHQLGVTNVHDLRGPAEIEHMGHDRLPHGIRLTVTPFDSGMGAAPPHAAQPDAALGYMREVYRAFPARPEAHAAIVAIAESIAASDGAVLVHCAAGKDRTGWAIATLLRAVEVTEAEVLADYLISNSALDTLRAAMGEGLGPGGGVAEELLGVSAEYLNAANEAAIELHGEFDAYLTALGLSAELRTRLRERLIG